MLQITRVPSDFLFGLFLEIIRGLFTSYSDIIKICNEQWQLCQKSLDPLHMCRIIYRRKYYVRKRLNHFTFVDDATIN